MIDKEEVKKLGMLSRVGIGDGEAEKIQKDLAAILDFVSALKEAPVSDIEARGFVSNVLREDGSPHEGGKYTEDLLNLAPEKEKGFVRVKKVI